MKRLFFLIITFLFCIFALAQPVKADEFPLKIFGFNYDNSSAVITVNTGTNTPELPEKTVRLSNPNRIYFDLNNAILVGEKQQIIFEKSPIKELKIAQFSTNPNIVRTVITFEEDFDSSKLKLFNTNGALIVKINTPKLTNDYFNTVYHDAAETSEYSSITVSSQAVKKIDIPVSTPENAASKTMEDIQKAFENSTLPNTNGQSYDSVISVDLSSKLKLRTKYYINQYIPKNGGLLVSGFGQLTTAKSFYLDSPKRLVIDLPNTYLEKDIRNKEVMICPNGACSDSAKIGQFEFNKARIVISSDNAEKYIPVYSKDAQSLFIVEAEKLNHPAIEPNISNINRAFVKKINSKTGELILSFTSPVVYSIVRTNDNFSIYLFNVKSYNEQDISKTLSNSQFRQLSLSLLPQIGVKAGIKINKNDNIKVEQSLDGKALRITHERSATEEMRAFERKQSKAKNKACRVVIDPGHGGSDYGAIREGINEKDIALDVSKRVESILRSKGIKASMTHKDDTYVSLEDRVAFAENEEPELFVSIHVNSAVATDPNGIETHWYHDYSKPFAETVHKHLIKELPDSKDRGLFKSKFYVINHTTMPAILCEIGFISNEEERNEMLTDSRKQKTAKAIAEGIIDFLKELK